MLNHTDYAATSTPLEDADTNLTNLINKGHDIHGQIEDLQEQLEIIDRSTDAAFHARNELAVRLGKETFRYLNDFVEATQEDDSAVV